MTPLAARLTAAWERSDAIFRLIAPPALYDQPISLRQPLIFYLGHLPAFAWNQVCRSELGMTSFEPVFDSLFERGIDPIGVDAYQAAARSQWPSEREVLKYRDRARRALLWAYESQPPTQVFEVAIEHELMHQETLLYMLQVMPPGRLKRGAAAGLLTKAEAAIHTDGAGEIAARPKKLLVPAGKATLGAKREEPGFRWDNELPEHEVDVPAFLMDRLPVTNAELLEFVLGGGYSKRELWSEGGWAWKEHRRMHHPNGWMREGGRFLYRTLFDIVPLEDVLSWPAHTSFAEAEAFARSRGERLPTEAELHRAMYGSNEGAARRYPWGDDEPGPERGNFHFQRLSPSPVGSYPRGASAWGVEDLIGSGWEWTSSLFAPFPGFEVTVPSYPGYSKDFFDDHHYVMLGGSWATDRALVRRSFRNWFQPFYPYVFAKFRCVAAAD